jgi:hypothetical protein
MIISQWNLFVDVHVGKNKEDENILLLMNIPFGCSGFVKPPTIPDTPNVFPFNLSLIIVAKPKTTPPHRA